MKKVITEIAHSSAVVRDHGIGITMRGGKVVGFGESQFRGRTAFGDVNNAGKLSYGIEGTTSKGEQGTLETCQLLVQLLNENENASKQKWTAPESVILPHIDCQSAKEGDSDESLNMQVVRAVTDQSHWAKLNIEGRVSQDGVTAAKLADELKRSIEIKKAKIPALHRTNIVLVLNAVDSPVMAFGDVVAAFASLHGEWSASLGFQAIWVVGPTAKLVHRLDQ